MAAIEHAGPAMDDQVVRGEVFWKVISSDKVEGKPLPYGLSQEPWNLFPSNIFRQRGMGAGLRNENRRALRQMRDGIGPIQEGLDVPLYPANRMEKEVRRLSGGFKAHTVGNAWESVMIR